ncbi:hypothetical protein PENTCL1PPCAC_24006, partial [Pristionchus entomophagus]
FSFRHLKTTYRLPDLVSNPATSLFHQRLLPSHLRIFYQCCLFFSETLSSPKPCISHQTLPCQSLLFIPLSLCFTLPLLHQNTPSFCLYFEPSHLMVSPTSHTRLPTISN